MTGDVGWWVLMAIGGILEEDDTELYRPGRAQVGEFR